MTRRDMAARIAKLEASVAYLEQEVAMRDLFIDQLKPRLKANR